MAQAGRVLRVVCLQGGQGSSETVFTAEGPEYWEKLAEHDIDTVVTLYQSLVDPSVRKSDLLRGGCTTGATSGIPSGESST